MFAPTTHTYHGVLGGRNCPTMRMEDPKVPLVYTGYRRRWEAGDSKHVAAKYFLRKAQNRPEPLLITKWWRAAKRNEYLMALVGIALICVALALTVIFQ